MKNSSLGSHNVPVELILHPVQIMSEERTARFSSDTLVLFSNQGQLDDTNSVSSCPSSSSSSSDDEGSPKPRLRRLKYTIPPTDLRIEYDTSSLVLLRHKSNPDKTVVVAPGFFSPERIAKLRTLFQTDKAAFEIKDRKDNLHYAHRAFRVEVALRLAFPKTYRRILESTTAVCDAVWGDIREKRLRRNRVLPEMEYIVYDLPAESGKGTFIEPHVDNHSLVTGVCMLSRPDIDFTGGVNRFKGSSEPVNDRKLNFREYKLQQGDLVLFRGEIVTHWITPVMTGVREIFQWELSRI